MSVSNYVTCPKCQKKYHVKAEKCPTCNITPEQHAEKLAVAAKKTQQKIQAKEERDIRKSFYCTACGSVFRRPKLVTRGNIIIEIFAWLLFLFPGIIYTIWRLTTRYKACPTCKAAQIIPANSPIAQRMLAG